MPDQPIFIEFYRTQYREEHRNAANVALHIVGVFAGLGVIGWALAAGPLWSAVLFPIAHAIPGLVGHRLFERHGAVGDIRVFRQDVPGWWFLIANHMLLADLIIPTRPFGLPR